ncbi:capsular exopolysaccharide family [Lachnospiraceae bacterium RM5]|nr:capsular exopolysaccharide family [Lachnospiraceae bacterium RM5]
MPYIEVVKKGFDNKSTDEAYKRLRANLSFCGNDIKVIDVTSTQSNEGKSVVAFNLAYTLAFSGRRTIYIDADLRNSVTLARYKIPGDVKGLTDYLVSNEALENVLCNTNIPNLDMILTGPMPPNPVELLENAEFADMLGLLRKLYDYVIIDTPPVGKVIDAVVVGRNCDGTVIVVAKDEVSTKALRRVKAQLNKANCKILGAVFNKVESKEISYKGGVYGEYGKQQ